MKVFLSKGINLRGIYVDQVGRVRTSWNHYTINHSFQKSKICNLKTSVHISSDDKIYDAAVFHQISYPEIDWLIWRTHERLALVFATTIQWQIFLIMMTKKIRTRSKKLRLKLVLTRKYYHLIQLWSPYLSLTKVHKGQVDGFLRNKSTMKLCKSAANKYSNSRWEGKGGRNLTPPQDSSWRVDHLSCRLIEQIIHSC